MSHVDRMNYGGAKFYRFALFPLMLLMLLLLPTSMVAQTTTEYDNTVNFKELAGSPKGYDNETYANLFDGKRKKVISLSGAASLKVVPTSSSKPARQECLWATLSLRVMTMQIGDVVVVIRYHGSSMVTTKAKWRLDAHPGG